MIDVAIRPFDYVPPSFAGVFLKRKVCKTDGKRLCKQSAVRVEGTSQGNSGVRLFSDSYKLTWFAL